MAAAGGGCDLRWALPHNGQWTKSVLTIMNNELSPSLIQLTMEKKSKTKFDQNQSKPNPGFATNSRPR
jgi:hypothetical protein